MFNPPFLQNYGTAQSDSPSTQSQANLTEFGTGERQDDPFFGYNLNPLQEGEILDPWLEIGSHTGSNLTEMLPSNPQQNDLGSPHPSDSELDQPQSDVIDNFMHNEPIMESLHFENELFIAQEPWKTKFDGVKMLEREISSRHRQE
ncbi:hypothetical protein B7463_g8321, partial [Scytalidium lignicola]